MGELLGRGIPEEVGQSVEVPDIELVVQRPTETHANEVRREESKDHLCGFVKGNVSTRR